MAINHIKLDVKHGNSPTVQYFKKIMYRISKYRYLTAMEVHDISYKVARRFSSRPEKIIKFGLILECERLGMFRGLPPVRIESPAYSYLLSRLRNYDPKKPIFKNEVMYQEPNFYLLSVILQLKGKYEIFY